MSKVNYIQKAIDTDWEDWPDDHANLVAAIASQSQAYALIAIAQELKRLNDRFDEWTDEGQYPGLRIWPYGQ